MNIYSLKEGLSALEQVGHTLNPPERMKLEMALIKLTDLAKADQLLFWGKIFTTSQPYYIAMALDFAGHYAFPEKKFYYTRDNMNFELLPCPDEYHKGKADQFNHIPFSGDPANILINVEGGQNQAKEPEKKNDDDSEQEKKVIEPKNFTQLNRLSHVVRAIEIECQVAPVGAFKMCEKHEIRYNQGFHGLKRHFISLSEFQHFRYPRNKRVIEALQKPDCIFRYDFLDPLENETHWVVQKNLTESLVTVRQLEWQGYVGYHFLERQEFGGAYFGSGCKNTEVSFYV